MKTFSRTRAWLLCAALASIVATGPAAAQEYPSRTVRIVVPFTPGGAVDVLGRIVAERLGAKWKQAVVVENRPGAGTVIATDVVAKSAPDGYTLLLAVTAHSVNATLVAKLPFDPVRDFAPVILAATAPNILVAHPSVPAESVRELIAFAKANPGKLNVGSPGKGTTMHLAAEMFKADAGLEFTIVHYKGTQPSLNALLRGEVSFLFDAGVSAPMIRAGRLKALAVTSAMRAAILPERPTMAESGMPGFVVTSWYGFLAPAGTPPQVVATINREINDVLKDPEARGRIEKIGLEPTQSTSEEFDRFIREQIEKWGKVVTSSGLKVE